MLTVVILNGDRLLLVIKFECIVFVKGLLLPAETMLDQSALLTVQLDTLSQLLLVHLSSIRVVFVIVCIEWNGAVLVLKFDSLVSIGDHGLRHSVDATSTQPVLKLIL